MTPARIAIVVGALVASIALALLVRGLIGHPKPAQVAIAAPAQATTQVLVAKADLGIGSILSPDNMRWQDWPATTLDPAYITSGQTTAAGAAGAGAALVQAKNVVTNMAAGGGPKLQSMVGAIVREEIAEGAPITARNIVRAGQSSYMAVRLPQGMRAMALPLSLESGAGGFIQPGDHVDVLSTHSVALKTGGSELVTDTVLADTLVLAIDQHVDTPKGGANLPGSTITIEVRADKAYSVAKARTLGGLSLALRSYADAASGGGALSDNSHDVRVFRGGAPADVVTAQ